MKTTRRLSLFLGIIFMLFLIASCAPAADTPDPTPDSILETPPPEPAAETSELLNITTTLFAYYDWTRQIIGENTDRFNLTFLLDDLIDQHSFIPSTRDIATIEESDLFIFTGGHSDGWTETIIEESEIPHALNLFDVLGLDPEDEHGDEHIYLSIQNAITIVGIISDTLAELDPEEAATYGTNAFNYIEELRTLDSEFIAMFGGAEAKPLLMADRMPFRPLLFNYGIDFYAAFSGCSAETEASPRAITSLAEAIDEYDLRFIFITETAVDGGAIARAVIEAANAEDAEILTLNSLKSVTAEGAETTTYLDIMRENFNILAAAFAGVSETLAEDEE